MNALLSLATLALLWGAAALGGLAFRWLEVPPPVRRLSGLGLVSLAGFALCALGFPPRTQSGLTWAPGALFGLGGVLGWIVIAREKAELACAAATVRATRISGAVFLAVLAVAFAWTQMPPTRVDEGAYHLSLPAHALELGHFDLIWGHIYTGFPGFGEMLFLWPLSLQAESGARGVQLVAVMLAVWCSIELIPKQYSARVIQGWVLLLTVPVAFVELPCAYVDLIQLSLELIAILCVHRFATIPDARQSSSSLLAGAWLAGCAAATKYLAFPTAVLIALMAVVGAVTRRRAAQSKPSLSVVTWALVAAVVPVIAWLAKNVVERGNPFFPFALGRFPSPEFNVLQQRIYEHQLAAVGPVDELGAPRWGWDAVRHLPYEILFGGKFTSLNLDGVIGPLVLVGVLLALAPRRPDEAWANPGRHLGLYGFFKLALCLGTSWQARFLLPSLVPICAAIPFWFGQLSSTPLRALGAGALVAALLFEVRAVSVALPRLDPRAFGPTEERHALRLELQPDTALCDAAQSIHPMKLMLVWSQRLSYWCPANQVSDSIIESLTLDDWLAAGGAENARQGLESRGITHVLIDEDRLLKLPNVRLPPAEKARYDRAAAGYAALRDQDFELVAHGKGRLLYALKPRPAR